MCLSEELGKYDTDDFPCCSLPDSSLCLPLVPRPKQSSFAVQSRHSGEYLHLRLYLCRLICLSRMRSSSQPLRCSKTTTGHRKPPFVLILWNFSLAGLKRTLFPVTTCLQSSSFLGNLAVASQVGTKMSLKTSAGRTPIIVTSHGNRHPPWSTASLHNLWPYKLFSPVRRLPFHALLYTH